MSITKDTEKCLANEYRHYEELNSLQLIISIKIKNPFNIENDKSLLWFMFSGFNKIGTTKQPWKDEYVT